MRALTIDETIDEQLAELEEEESKVVLVDIETESERFGVLMRTPSWEVYHRYCVLYRGNPELGEINAIQHICIDNKKPVSFDRDAKPPKICIEFANSSSCSYCSYISGMREYDRIDALLNSHNL